MRELCLVRRRLCQGNVGSDRCGECSWHRRVGGRCYVISGESDCKATGCALPSSLSFRHFVPSTSFLSTFCSHSKILHTCNNPPILKNGGTPSSPPRPHLILLSAHRIFPCTQPNTAHRQSTSSALSSTQRSLSFLLNSHMSANHSSRPPHVSFRALKRAPVKTITQVVVESCARAFTPGRAGLRMLLLASSPRCRPEGRSYGHVCERGGV